MSDPHEPPGPEGPDDPATSASTPASGGYDAPPPPPPGSADPYGGAASGTGAPGQPSSGQPDYGQHYSQPYGQQPGPGLAAGEQPGGLVDRFLARLLDSVILVIVTSIVDLALLAGAFGMTAGSGLGVGGSYAYGALAGIIGVAINLGYFGYLESSRGQTIGKMALKLHVQSSSGGLPTFEQAVKRNIWLALPLLGIFPLIGGAIGGLAELVAVILIAVGISSDSATRRPWTDKYADTRVLKTA
jgi:uncharacterized RDD family membrane protein YckC